MCTAGVAHTGMDLPAFSIHENHDCILLGSRKLSQSIKRDRPSLVDVQATSASGKILQRLIPLVALRQIMLSRPATFSSTASRATVLCSLSTTTHYTLKVHELAWHFECLRYPRSTLGSLRCGQLIVMAAAGAGVPDVCLPALEPYLHLLTTVSSPPRRHLVIRSDADCAVAEHHLRDLLDVSLQWLAAAHRAHPGALHPLFIWSGLLHLP